MLLPENLLIRLVLNLLDSEHRNRVRADLHLWLEMLAEVVVESELGDVECFADHSAGLHRA